jgi:hypothetical protein
VHAVDRNEALIVDAMRIAGATVYKLGRPLDLLVAVHGQTGLAEVKMPKGKLRASQSAFLATWPGLCAILRTPEEGMAFVRQLKRDARAVRAHGVTDVSSTDSAILR